MSAHVAKSFHKHTNTPAKFAYSPDEDIPWNWVVIFSNYNKWWGKIILRTGALEDISMISPTWMAWLIWEPSIYITPLLQVHVATNVWSCLINPCIRSEAAPGEIGSLVMYCRSRDKIGIGNPPAECIAAVEPAAVETRRPLDLQLTRGEHGVSPSLILQKYVLSWLLYRELMFWYEIKKMYELKSF